MDLTTIPPATAALACLLGGFLGLVAFLLTRILLSTCFPSLMMIPLLHLPRPERLEQQQERRQQQHGQGQGQEQEQHGGPAYRYPNPHPGAEAEMGTETGTEAETVIETDQGGDDGEADHDGGDGMPPSLEEHHEHDDDMDLDMEELVPMGEALGAAGEGGWIAGRQAEEDWVLHIIARGVEQHQQQVEEENVIAWWPPLTREEVEMEMELELELDGVQRMGVPTEAERQLLRRLMFGGEPLGM